MSIDQFVYIRHLGQIIHLGNIRHSEYIRHLGHIRHLGNIRHLKHVNMRAKPNKIRKNFNMCKGKISKGQMLTYFLHCSGKSQIIIF